MNLDCSNCRRNLCEVEDGDSYNTVEVVALCGYCGDKSFPVTVAKPLRFFGAVEADEDHADGFRELTEVVSAVTDAEGVLVLETRPVS